MDFKENKQQKCIIRNKLDLYQNYKGIKQIE